MTIGTAFFHSFSTAIFAFLGEPPNQWENPTGSGLLTPPDLGSSHAPPAALLPTVSGRLGLSEARTRPEKC